MANRIAPEHLELSVADPEALLPAIHNAGAVFLGHYTPEAIGDYVAGPDHVLPTGGTARFSSPLNVDDFIKKMSVLCYSREAFTRVAETCVTLSDTGGASGRATPGAGALAVRSAASAGRSVAAFDGSFTCASTVGADVSALHTRSPGDSPATWKAAREKRTRKAMSFFMGCSFRGCR